MDIDRTLNKKPVRLSRRAVLKMVAAGLLTGCLPRVGDDPGAGGRDAPTSAPTASDRPTATEPVRPSPTFTRQPTSTPVEAPTSTPTPPATVGPTATTEPEPAAEMPVWGGVVRARHAGVWQNDEPAPDAVREMLDAAMTALTGRQNPREAWAALFSPSDRVAIKVNAIRSSSFWTNVTLTSAVVESLQTIGVPAEQIVIFDRQTRELEEAGFPVNRDGPGVRCYGTDGAYTRSWRLLESEIGVSDILLNSDALINIPLLKAHGTSGMSFALKNHYGTFDQPARYHASIDRALGALNALQPIAERTRLTIGDALNICTRGWHRAVNGDSVLVSRDPVAHDVVGAQMLAEAAEAEGGNSTVRQRTAPWLDYAAQLGLGIAAIDDIELVEIEAGG